MPCRDGRDGPLNRVRGADARGPVLPAKPRGRGPLCRVVVVIRRSSSLLFQTQSGVSRTKTCGVPRATATETDCGKDLALFYLFARRDVALRTPPTHSRCHTSARSVSMLACVSSPVAARAPASGANAPRARRTVACAARADRSADEAKSVSVADRLRGAAVATAAAAALVACAPDAALANAFDGDLSPTNGPLKSLPKGARAPPPPRVPSRDLRSFLVHQGRSGSSGVGERHLSTRSAAFFSPDVFVCRRDEPETETRVVPLLNRRAHRARRDLPRGLHRSVRGLRG